MTEESAKLLRIPAFRYAQLLRAIKAVRELADKSILYQEAVNPQEYTTRLNQFVQLAQSIKLMGEL